MTAFCPTIVTSAPEVYHRVLPWLGPRPGGAEDGAEILGAHIEGPFISKRKKGAHDENLIQGELDKDGKMVNSALENAVKR